MHRRTYAAAAAAAALVALTIVSVGCASKTASPAVKSKKTSASAVATATATTAPTAPAVAAQQPVPPETNPPGDIPDNQAFVAYSAAGGFSVKVPEGWSRQETPSSAEFTDKLNTIRVAWASAASAPTIATVQSVDVPKLQSSEAAFALSGIGAVALPAGPAILAKYQENSAPNSVTGKQYRLDVLRYSVFHNGMRVDLTLLSPVGADNVDPWKIVTQSLTWK
jgi:hypothetical protein